jgi:iron complex outermembrane recepter protein
MRIAVLATAISAAVVGLAWADPAAAAFKAPTNIAPQELASALRVLAAERHLQILYTTETVANHRTSGAVGELTVDEALTRLLGGTGLAFRYVDEKTITIVPRADGRGTEGEESVSGGEARQSLWSRLRFAQANAASPLEAAGPGVDRAQATAAQRAEDPARSQDGVGQEDIVVTGSRLKGITADNGPAPVTVFDRKKIERLGITTLPDFFRYVTQQPTVKSEESMSGAGGQYVDLRGIGTGFTAVLINGRPAAATASSGTFNALDINSIPLAAIERVEILTSSASAVYGANAMGGAINIVLKRDLGRPVVDVRYGTAEGGAVERRASASTGYSNERFRASLLLDYFDRGELLGGERDRWANQDFRRFGSIDRRSTSSNPTTVTSASTANLPGLNSRFAAVPTGSSGIGLTPADFTATAGQRNFDSLGRFRSIVGEQDRRSGTVSGEFVLTPAVTAFGEYFREESESIIHQAPSALPLVVPANNEFNPFDVPVTVSYLFTGVGPRTRYSEAQSDRLLLGLRGGLASWDWEVAAMRTKGDGLQRSSDNAVDFARANAALAATAPAETLNVFQDGPGGSPSLLASLVAPVTVTQNHEGDTRHADAQLRGPLWQLPAGTVQGVIGGARSEDEILFVTNSFPRPVEGKRTASAAFAEIGVPLVSAEMQVPAVAELRLTLAGRHDDYNDFGTTTNPQYGLVWSPVRDVSVRLSYGTSFSPPNLFSMFAPLQQFPSSVTDPRRNNETVPIALLVGGNPDLQPVNGETTTAGLVLTPVPGLRLTATYWELKVDNRVTVVPDQQLVNNEAVYSDRVIRAAPTQTDIDLGLPGRIVSVDSTRINFGELRTSGVDWEASYSLDTRWGNFTPGLTGTRTATYSSVELPGSAPVKGVGIASINGTIPKWKMSATLAWRHEWMGASATARYVHGYDDAIFGLGPTGRRVASQTLVDTQASVDFGRMRSGHSSWLENLRLTAGIANLFDKEPPFAELFFDAGYDYTQADLIGRTGYLNLSKGF